MNLSNSMITLVGIIVIIIIIAVIGAIMLSFKKTKKGNHYTSKDRDMIELIHELSEIYRKTNKYIKK